MNQSESGNLDLRAAWGQILQLSIQALSLFVAGKGAWPDLTASKYLSPGALLFYALVGLVVWSFVWMVRSNQRPPVLFEKEMRSGEDIHGRRRKQHGRRSNTKWPMKRRLTLAPSLGL